MFQIITACTIHGGMCILAFRSFWLFSFALLANDFLRIVRMREKVGYFA